MGLFDKFNKVKEAVIGKPMAEKPIMKITMMGARGVGKTSVLTSMYNNMNTAINDTQLHLVADVGTDMILRKKTEELKKMFFAGNDVSDDVSSGIAGDQTVSVFSFDFGLNTANINMGLELRDFPGEYVRDEPEKVKQYIAESNAIIVAIDTPHLMECDGKYNEGKNYTSTIIGFIKEMLTKDSGEKLVMLVPLKCEKYYWAGEITAVTERVKVVYGDLIKHLKSVKNEEGKAKFACVISPIQTVGEIVFDCFEAKDGVIEEFSMGSITIPKKVKYKYMKPGATYSPKYCEQPLYYLLAFIAKQYRAMKEAAKNSGLWGRFKNRFLDMFAQSPEGDQLALVFHQFITKKVDKAEGFEVCCGRGKV